jgi:hypothetical protein
VIQDDIVRELLHDSSAPGDKGKTKSRPRVDSLLNAVDLDRVMSLEGSISERGNLPRGAISFIFEKVSKMTLEEEPVADDSLEEST